jgi:hypothetical protein
MSKRRIGRAGRKATAAGKRGTVKDLSAHKARGVAGGLLPALQGSPNRSRGADDRPLESISFVYGKI